MTFVNTTAMRRGALALSFLFAVVAAAGCAVKFVADYDAATVNQLLEVGKKIDVFYGTLLDRKPETRTYADYSPRYVEIEADLRSLWMRNKARPLNEESTQIARITLDLWVKYKNAHKLANAYPDAKAEAHRDRFERLFVSAVTAETAKKLDDEEGATP
jgi:hypothetical protein